jgi:regulator of protease activity HflC (stomatin/prohibitin superfamily)
VSWLAIAIEFAGEYLWPFEVVSTGERGVLYIFGNAMKWRLPPFVYFYIPYFTDIVPVSILDVPFSTPLLNITLSDNKTLSYSVTGIGRVTNPYLALTAIDDYEDSIQELLPSCSTEKLMEVDAARLDHDSRRRLLTSLKQAVNAATKKYGMEFSDVRFVNFAVDQRAYRFLVDSALPATEN